MASRVSVDEVAAAAAAVLETALTAAQFAAQFTPVPALAPAIQAVVSIIQVCGKINSNKLEIQYLQKRCNLFVEAINDPNYLDSKSAESLIQISEKATTHLKEIQTLLDKHARYSRWGGFLKQHQISQDLETCHRGLDDCYAEFDVKLNLQLRQWQEQHTRAYEKDHNELTRVLAHLDQNDSELKEIANETRNTVLEVLCLLQSQLSNREGPHQNIQCSLYHAYEFLHELPTELNITEQVTRIEPFSFAGGPLFDIYQGSWLDKKDIALKKVRHNQVSSNALRRFERELDIWRKIWDLDRGKHILPLYGICANGNPFPFIVSPWMDNGTVMKYLKKYPRRDRVEMAKGIAEGLKFLHGLSPPIAHSDVRGENILIDDYGKPILAGFGLSRKIEDITGVPFTQSQGIINSYRWLPPEISTPPGVISICSDVFSFALTIIEMVTMEAPYSHIILTTEVLSRMERGERPLRPEKMNDLLWEVCNACWRHTPSERATMIEVVDRLEERN